MMQPSCCLLEMRGRESDSSVRTPPPRGGMKRKRRFSSGTTRHELLATTTAALLFVLWEHAYFAAAFMIPRHSSARTTNSRRQGGALPPPVIVSTGKQYQAVSLEHEQQVPKLFVDDDDNLSKKELSNFKIIINKPASSNSDASEEKDNGTEEGREDISSPVCRVVTLSDSKLPASKAILPQSIFQSPDILRRMDDIYHSMAHDETRRLQYMDKSSSTASEYDVREEKKLVSVLRSSLEDAGFELLSRRDLDLCEALNAGYLLRLSILPDVSELDPSIAQEFYPERFNNLGKNKSLNNTMEEMLFDGRVLVFWRGYSQEVSRGRLLLPKIDYLQASIVQRSAAWLKARLDVLERWLSIKTVQICQKANKVFLAVSSSLLDRIVPNKQMAEKMRQRLESSSTNNRTYMTSAPGKLFKLARYGGSKIRFVGSPNPTDALNPFVICEQEECAPSVHDRRKGIDDSLNMERHGRNVDKDIYDCLNNRGLKCPYDARANRGKSDPMPPMQLLKRVTISSLVDLFSREGRRSLLNTIFSKSELVEPTYEEVVVVWRPKPKRKAHKRVLTPPKFMYEVADMFDIDGLPSLPQPHSTPPAPLEIRAFSSVPMANLPAVLPKTKLVFRPADAFVFDFVSIFSLALAISSQKLDNPKLDLLALVSVSLWVIRTVLRYSNKLARYDLLVKKFLTSKISHRNSGAVKYIATEAGSQRAVRAALVHSWLTNSVTDSEAIDRSELVKRGVTEVNELVQDYKQIPVDIDAALNDLEDLDLVKSTSDGKMTVVRDSMNIIKALKAAWGNVFDGRLTLKALVGRRRHE